MPRTAFQTSKVKPGSEIRSNQVSISTFIGKEDFSNFTLDKWKNKIFTDPRVRSKLKDRNYKVKLIEDLVLTRNAAQKQMQEKWDVKLSEEAISVGADSVIFPGIFRDRATTRDVVVKIWNKPSKQLVESKKKFYENDLEFSDLVEKSNSSEFACLWAERELKKYQNLQKLGIRCPKPILCEKNLMMMELENDTPLDHYEKDNIRHLHRCDVNILKTMKDLYMKAGLVAIDLNAGNVSPSGLMFNVGQTVSTKSNSDAMDMLFQNCQNIYSFFTSNEMTGIPSAEKMFIEVTGIDYMPTRKSTAVKVPNDNENFRKIEKKSERSLLAAKLRNQ